MRLKIAAFSLLVLLFTVTAFSVERLPQTDRQRRAFERTLPSGVIIDYGPSGSRMRYGGNVNGKPFTRGECDICELMRPGMSLIPASEATPANIEAAGRDFYYASLSPGSVVDWGPKPDAYRTAPWVRYGGREPDGTPFSSSDPPPWFKGTFTKPPQRDEPKEGANQDESEGPDVVHRVILVPGSKGKRTARD